MKTLSLKKIFHKVILSSPAKRLVILVAKVTVVCLSLLYASTLMSQPPAEEIYNLAVNAYKSGDFRSASHYLEEYVKLRPEPQAYYLLGYSYYKLKLFDKAESAFNEAYLIDPELVPPKLDSEKSGSVQ